MLEMIPFLNHKYFELMTTGPGFTALMNAWTDDEHLQFSKDSLAYYEFVVEFLTQNNGAMARVIDAEPRHIDFMKSTIEWKKESIQNDEFSRKARAFCREKEAKEKAANPPEPLPPDTITIGPDIKAAVLLSFKYN